MLFEMIDKYNAEINIAADSIIPEKKPEPSGLMKVMFPDSDISILSNHSSLCKYFKQVTGKELPSADYYETITQLSGDSPELERVVRYWGWLDKKANYEALVKPSGEMFKVNVKILKGGKERIIYTSSILNYMQDFFPTSLIGEGLGCVAGHYKAIIQIKEPYSSDFHTCINIFETLIQRCSEYARPVFLHGSRLALFIPNERKEEFYNLCGEAFEFIELPPRKHVYSQEQFDRLIKSEYAGVLEICFGYIGNEAAVYGDCTAQVHGKFHVRTWGEGAVVARDEVIVVAEGKVRVYAHDRSNIVAKGNVYVNAQDDATVIADDNAMVDAFNKANVIAKGSSETTAHDYASVKAFENAEVFLEDSAKAVSNDKSRIIKLN